MNLPTILILAQAVVMPQQVGPVLEFPEAGLDDSIAYAGYRTRFYRDAAGNAFQVYIDAGSGRVVHVWANAANESAAFTARGAGGEPARLAWGAGPATVSADGDARTVEYGLEAESPVELGFFLLGSMRVERDFQYRGLHRRPFDGAAPFRLEELVGLVRRLERLDVPERAAHLALLGAESMDALRGRLTPSLAVLGGEDSRVLRVERPSFDGRNRMVLEVEAVDPRASLELRGRTAVIRSAGGGPVRLRVRVTTDADALSPLSREDIFNDDFFRYYAGERAAYEAALAVPEPERDAADRARILRFRRMERLVRSAELLSTREKLMAGMPNYATYFGRDMLMTALMMEPVWRPAMREHVIASVLRKLSPAGEVSHEEALGGQAIRENAVAYGELVDAYLRTGDRAALERARTVLGSLQAVRENYRMLDDDLQFPVLVARYLADPSVSRERKRSFLLAPAGRVRADAGPDAAGAAADDARAAAAASATAPGSPGRPDGTRLALLLRNLAYVARVTAPYADDPTPGNLIAFPRRDAAHWHSGSWRDSGPGYANGRFAMDVNAIWAPAALEAVATILDALRALGFDATELVRAAPPDGGTRLARYIQEPEALREAARVWRGAERHFVVTLSAREAEARVAAKLAWLPESERRAWERVLRSDPLDGGDLTFLAIALDSAGRPIPVASTDAAMRLFLDAARGIGPDAEWLRRALRITLLPYPVGLFLESVGVVATNDAYAGREVWEAFRRDPYHSPTTIWGREVNLLLLGLAQRIEMAERVAGGARGPAADGPGAAEALAGELRVALRRVRRAVEASGLAHSELWSYRVADGRVVPMRYATSTDIQLWNVTDLAVRYRLSRLEGAAGRVSILEPARPAAAVREGSRVP
ncbi:MAG TPA: hypothetical protein VF212_10925 [Longimicrobiales bacterium]